MYLKKALAKIGIEENSLLFRFFTFLSLDVLVRASSIVTLPIFIAIMPQDEFGQYNYLVNTISIFGSIMIFGFHIPLAKLYLEQGSDISKGIVLNTIFSTLLLFLFITYLAFGFFRVDELLAVILFNEEFNYSEYRLILLGTFLITVFSGILLNFFINAQKIKQITLFNLLKLFSVSIIPLIALYFFEGNTVSVRLKAAYFSEALIVLFFFQYPLREFVFSFSFKVALRAIKLAIPYWVSTIPTMFMVFVDKYMLQHQVGYADLSVYYLAFAIAGIISMLASSFNNAWFPEIFKSKDIAENLNRTDSIVRKLTVIYVALSMVLILGAYIALELNIIKKEYYGILSIIPILCVGQILMILSKLYNILLVYLEKSYVFLIVNLSIVAPVTAFAYFLCERYGVLGAAMSNVFSGFLNFIVYYLIVRNARKKNIIANG